MFSDLPFPEKIQVDRIYASPPENQPVPRYIIVQVSKYRYCIAQYTGSFVVEMTHDTEGNPANRPLNYEIISRSDNYQNISQKMMEMLTEIRNKEIERKKK